MEGIKTQDQLLGQDDIDALLAGAEADNSSTLSGEVVSAATEGEEKSKGTLDQDDIDALLSQFGSDGNDEHNESQPLTGLREPKKVSDEYVRALSAQILNSSLLSREAGVQVIWNALDTLPMNTDLSLNIQGMEYKTLGTLHTKHLVVKNEDLT